MIDLPNLFLLKNNLTKYTDSDEKHKLLIFFGNPFKLLVAYYYYTLVEIIH